MPYFQVNRKLLLIKIHYFLGIGGYAPFSPFLTTISKQRGYSAFIVGLIFMLQPIPGMLIRPIVGAVTDKYKCRRSVFIASSIITFVLVCLLSIIPGTTSKEEMNDLDVIKSPLFWMFFTTIALINTDGTVKSVLEDTICMDLLGKNSTNNKISQYYTLRRYLEDLSNVYHPETKSWMKTLQGIALLIQCFGGEVPSFILSSYILKRVDHMTIFSIVFFTFTCIFSVYTIIENPLWALPVELMNGITFALSYSAAISYAALIAPTGAEGTLQGVVGTAYTGIGAPIGSFVGGYMFKHIGSIASFKLLSVVAFFTCVIQIIVNYILKRLSKNEDVKDIYSKVKTKDDNIEEDITLTS
ncbi:PREDICTED: uncharacterized protein LOC107167801 [Diuraphis noxia]|uniref:uncharacterized protein LOC107167801 n=1 Tax=Diuraphis noxia TaxID=143948 RepID=UPI0007636CB9|nr:PREDICTED: uncharacterized protein LOC107167801 [Diuraphis noxia]